MGPLVAAIPVGMALKAIGSLFGRRSAAQANPQANFAQALASALSERGAAPLDRDGNGFITAGEFDVAMARNRVGGRARAMADAAVRKLDYDRDGVLSRTEMGVAKDVFDAADVNGDRVLDRGELERAYGNQGRGAV